MTVDDFLANLANLNAPDQGMRYHSGGHDASAPAFDERTGKPLPPVFRPAELTVYGERARFIYAVIEGCAELSAALRAQPQAREDYSSLIAARCSALPDKLIDCPVCLAVDNERDRLAREEAQPVMTVTLVDAGPALAIRKWDNLGLTPGSHTLYTTPPTQPLAEGADAEKLRIALEEAADAVDFFDRVKAATGAERTAVGSDHWKRIEAALRALAALQQEDRPDA